MFFLFLSACVTQESFPEDYIQANCEWLVACEPEYQIGTESVEECVRIQVESGAVEEIASFIEPAGDAWIADARACITALREDAAAATCPNETDPPHSAPCDRAFGG